MANFVVVVDPNPEQRSHFIKTIQPLISPVEGLIVNHCTTANFCAIWAAHTHAPISYINDEEGAAVVWGEAIKYNDSMRMNASQLRNIWKESNYQTLPTFDGFYAAVVYHPHLGVTVAADILGLFPVYYYTSGEVTLIASSPELFRYHPRFYSSFNPAGLVGILLTNGLFNGQTLWANIQRLGAGKLLICQPNTPSKEINQYTIPYSEKLYSDLTFTEQLDVLDQLLEQIIKRHVDIDKKHILLLSGGLDSRMLAGFVHRQNVDTVGLTFGLPKDIEMECAISVARTLGFEHHSSTVPFEQYPLCANKLLKWEHLANGFNGIMGWVSHSHLSPLAPRVIVGYILDVVVGPKAFSSFHPKNVSFAKNFPGFNKWALQPQLLHKLLRKEIFGNLVEDTLTEIQKVYESYSEIELQRPFYFHLYHRSRYQLGSQLWRMSFGAWPILPVLDWELLKTSLAMPAETLAKRKAQIALISTRFPQLAQLPLDRNGYNTEPLQPSQTREMLAPLFELQSKWRKLQQKLGYERRYYYRIYNINNDGWQAVRRQAEPCRESIQHLFNPEVLDQIVPHSDIIIHGKLDEITGVSGLKTLIGLSLWSQEYL